MKRLLLSARPLLGLAALAALLVPAPSAPAAAPASANGGGPGTVDGTTPFSQFGFGVTRAADGTVRGRVVRVWVRFD